MKIACVRKLGRIPEEGPSFRVETSCSIKRLLEDEETLLLNNGDV